MAFSPSSSHRLHTAYFLLVASFSANVLAYTPPATPNLPLFFEFTGANAVSESTDFYNSQCDSDSFSWYGVDWFCATGDPSNPVCQVKMAYHSTDVNSCQNSSPPLPPEPNLTPDVIQNGSGDNQKLIEKLELIRIGQFNKLVDDGLYQDTDLSLARQTNSLLSSLSRTLSYANDNRSVVDAINTWGATNWNESRNQFAQNNVYRTQQDADSKATFLQEMGYIGMKLNYMHDTLYSIDNKSGSGGGSTDYTHILNGIADDLAYLKFDIIGSLNSNAELERDLLAQLNASIKSLGGTPSDNSAIVDQLIDSNNSLSDITLRMRDIENAIGKSEQSIVDAIGNGGSGSGSDPDAITENGCVTFVCSTNSPQCYIAKKEWESRCKASSDEIAAQNAIDSAKTSLDDFINSTDSDIQNLDAGTVDIKQFTNHYNSSNGVNFGGSDTCPPPYVVDAKITTFTLDLTPFCDLATVIKFFLIAFASIASGLMIVKYH